MSGLELLQCLESEIVNIISTVTTDMVVRTSIFFNSSEVGLPICYKKPAESVG